jgi:hypothetical protein
VKELLTRQPTTNPEPTHLKCISRLHVSTECCVPRSSIYLCALLEYLGDAYDYFVRVNMGLWMCKASSRRLLSFWLEIFGTSDVFILHAGIRVLRCADAMLSALLAVQVRAGSYSFSSASLTISSTWPTLVRCLGYSRGYLAGGLKYFRVFNVVRREYGPGHTPLGCIEPRIS